MDYDFQEIEARWQEKWEKNQTYHVSKDELLKKYYVLDMFPYPSGAGLHVGHPLGYIASDIIARYKRHLGYNVLHPMGYDSFGLPAEQYAIQTGQHPAITTQNNIDRYRQQLKRLGFNYDWSRELRTSDPHYYKWTQWTFSRLFDSWYNKKTDKAEPISSLIAAFEENGSYAVEAAINSDWYKSLNLDNSPFGEHFAGEFTDTDWQISSANQKLEILENYRLAYLSDTMVNWCEALGTVLANDEVKDGRSERGGHPVVQRRMKQWSLRITAYADRLLKGLEDLDWNESIKEIQRNWIGKSIGATVRFFVEKDKGHIDVFTTRPDTIFGATFIVVAPEHPLVTSITEPGCKKAVDAYIGQAAARSERERQSTVKEVTGAFTGAYAQHPFSGDLLPIWVADYVLAGYGTGAIMAVPAGDQRDLDFAKAFDLPIRPIFADIELKEVAYAEKVAKLKNSGFLNGLKFPDALKAVIFELEQKRIGYGKTNFRLRDAIFSRQRYWGEPFPVYYEKGRPHLLNDTALPLTLPKVDKYLPTQHGEPPLARADKKDWDLFLGDQMEYNTMPGWAGSSWYFIRYLDPRNPDALASDEALQYWQNVDLYIGGAEHATGHLLYARFWTKFLYDRGYIPFDEPFKKMVNQGMILGRSSLVYRLELSAFRIPGVGDNSGIPSVKDFPQIFVSAEIFEDWKQHGRLNIYQEETEKRLGTLLYELLDSDHEFNLSEIEWEYGFTALHTDVSMVHQDELDIAAFRKWRKEYIDAVFICATNSKFHCGNEVEKMSKRWYNVITPDELCEKYGADTLRMYEMFLGPVEQSKPWDTQGINGVHNFLRKFWRLFYTHDGHLTLSEADASKAELRILHQTIKKVTEDLERLSWNTVVSTLMIAVNELTAENSNNKSILSNLLILISPYAPHFAEELWYQMGNRTTITSQPWPIYNAAHLELSEFEYPVSFNGKMRFKLALSTVLTAAEVEMVILENAKTKKYLDGKKAKKVIVVPKRIVNIVF